MKKNLLVLFTSVIVFVFLSSHDYYLLSEKYFLSKGDTLITRMYFGDAFVLEEERPYQEYIIRKFDWVSSDKTENLMPSSKDSMFPALTKRMENSGLGLVAMERSYAFITLTPEKFTKYLEEERLTNIIELRKKSATRTAEREKYTRYLKSLVCVDAPKGDQYKRIVGHKLEIILLQNPYTIKKGKELTAQVLFQGKPLENASIEVMSKDAAGKIEISPMTSDINGEIRFKVARNGEWVVRLVHMVPCENCTDADWESFWASYSFGVKQ